LELDLSSIAMPRVGAPPSIDMPSLHMPTQTPAPQVDLGDLGSVLARVAHDAAEAQQGQPGGAPEWEAGDALRQALAAERQPRGEAGLDLPDLSSLGKSAQKKNRSEGK